MKYERGTSSVHAGCKVQTRHVFSMSEVHHQYKQGCIVQTSTVDHQVLVQEGTTQKYFPMNESLLLPLSTVKRVSSLWQAAKFN